MPSGSEPTRGTQRADRRGTRPLRRWPSAPVARLKSGRRPGGRRERRRWESNPLRPGCSRSPGRLAPASVFFMCSPGVEPGPRPSHGRVPSPTLQGRHSCTDPPPGSRARPCGFEDRRAFRHTRGGRDALPLPGVEPGLRPSEGRVPSVTLQGRFTFRQGRRPDSNRHGPVYKTGAFPSATSARAA